MKVLLVEDDMSLNRGISFTFPAIETLICIAAILLTLIITSSIVVNKITRVSVVEQIKFED